MVDIAYNDTNDRWSIPDDRQLALRGRLQTGWSSYQQDIFTSSKKHSLTVGEQDILRSVLEKKDRIQQQEQMRIGGLVKKLEDMRSKVLGDGQTTCLICGTKAGLLKDQLRYCTKCSKLVCPKCSIDTKCPEVTTKAYFCVLCFEERQLWKRSGAWFFNSMPKYTLPENNEYRYGTLNRNTGSLYNGTIDGNLSKGSSYLDLHQNDNYDSMDDDEGSDSDVDETSSVKAFVIPEDRRSWHTGIGIDEENVGGTSSVGRRNAVSTEGRSSPAKKPAKASSLDRSNADSDSSDGSNQPLSRNECSFTTQISVSSSEGPNDRRGSMTSLSSVNGLRKHKLGIKRVLRKVSRDDQDKMSNFEKSPLSARKSVVSDSSHKNLDSVSVKESEQDIDAMFKDYESEQAKEGTKEQNEYTGKYGMLEFTLQYDPNTQELLVIVHNCKGLTGDKGKMPALPYVKTFILPEAQKATKKRTSSLKKTSEPVYNETLVYHGISDLDIQNKGLKLCVMDEQKVGSNGVIGETSIPLKNLINRPVQQFRRILDLKSNDNALFLDTKKTTSNPGRIELALHYLSKQGKLVVGIIRCSGLKALDPNGYSDPYVKCYLLPDPQKKTKQKTQVKKKTLNPEFNEEFTYKIPHAELAKRTLHISVWDYDMGRSNDFIGGITLGIESSGDLLRHWFETLQTQDRRVIKWHTLSESCPIINE